MSTLPITYPVTPAGVDETILQPSSTFKQEVSKVLLAILFFIAVYLVLMAAAIGLAFLCSAAGILLAASVLNVFTLMIGLGLVGLGVMVIFFLLKFLFKRNKADRSHLIELKEADQPELFAFVKALTEETQSRFPKRIYVSAEVNASVFYDSNFWSMFLPIRKNLHIGLGLVNSVNLSEFKAVLAHEFGHFSQRSMKLGSYVYNVNQIIYNMLYDNDGYGRTLEKWANISDYFVIFARITFKIAVGIQWVLQKIYSIVNKTYMGLSRQMEFHADSVSAYVSGSDHLITSLHRLELADHAYNRLFQYYDLWYKENIRPENLYPHHAAVMKRFAQEQQIAIENELPQVNANSFARFNRTRLVIKDQWASHPSTEDREAHLRKLNIRTETVKTSAWKLFRNAEALQKEVTEKIYSHVKFQNPPRVIDLNGFLNLYDAELEKYRLNKLYNGFFNYRDISIIDLKNLDEFSPQSTLEEILNDQTLDLPYVIEGLKTDLHNLGLIQQGNLPVKTFEFDGKKYKKSDCDTLIPQLKNELADTEARLVAADAKVISFFINAARAQGIGERLKERYSELFQVTKSTEGDLENYRKVIEDIHPIYYNNLPFTEIQTIMVKVKNTELVIKDRLRELTQDDGPLTSFLKDDEKNTIAQYLSKGYEYFKAPNFDNEALDLFNQAMNIYQNAVSERSFSMKKELLNWQLSFLEDAIDNISADRTS